MDKNIVFEMQNYLNSRGLLASDDGAINVKRRAKGHSFSIEEHIKGMVYSLLSAQTVWANIERNLSNIDKLFFYYNPEEIKKCDYMYFVEGLAKLRCHSRLTNNQMKVLKDNVEMMERIEGIYGSMDEFVTSENPVKIVELLSSASSKYKLKQMGEALTWEYLRNVGVDGAKPDVHLKRMLGRDRLGYSIHDEANNYEVIEAMGDLSESTGLFMAQLDYIFWCYCASGKGEICTATPNCSRCAIKSHCKKDR